MVAMKKRDMKDNKSPWSGWDSSQITFGKIWGTNQHPACNSVQFVIKGGNSSVGLKEANIIPLFKKGSRNMSENYRPVTLTSVICKLFERLKITWWIFFFLNMGF
ncbi:hypothetical protein NP493_126g04018 [Ridgeia piscesae]|uniref:Uncharacterized protein n=1 Tax=Ridgeia piscesae TaxID=27915 RepID=A0AAD9UGT7_RIDPI|nr:hypothetical protein NP493_126g04018 [Ridgeia piscesae]